jgi:hypothetical protein
LPTAILAGVLVTTKYLESAQLLQVVRTLDHVDQPDYRRYLKYLANGVKLASAVFQHFSLATKNQDYGPARATQVEGLITLVKDQYRRVYHGYYLVIGG